ncbi:hypothetical protein HY636_00500 [Candidatus Woesearchaeota archaeon]|nr:hypothetical protein [Candidatus Woesearchaeota archaeon]
MEERISGETRNILKVLFNRKSIGNAHFPEDLLFKRLKNIHDKQLRKLVDEEWKKLENEGFIVRMKKKTHKGNDFHVSLNPKRIFEVKEMIGGTND